jgi:hypothetical protein
MKTRISRILTIAAALIFVGSGVSFAHDWNDRNHKPPGKAYGHYKAKKHSPGWNDRYIKRGPRYNKTMVYKEVHHHRYYDNHRWRPAPRPRVVHKVVKRDPVVVFKVVLNDLR